jgi:hypothetical protein
MASRRIYGAGLLLVGAAVAYASVASGEKKEDVPAVVTKASGFFPATVNGFTMTVGECPSQPATPATFSVYQFLQGALGSLSIPTPPH